MMKIRSKIDEIDENDIVKIRLILMEIFRCDFALQKILIPMPFARNEAFKKYYNAFKIKLIKIIKIIIK